MGKNKKRPALINWFNWSFHHFSKKSPTILLPIEWINQMKMFMAEKILSFSPMRSAPSIDNKYICTVKNTFTSWILIKTFHDFENANIFKTVIPDLAKIGMHTQMTLNKHRVNLIFLFKIVKSFYARMKLTYIHENC